VGQRLGIRQGSRVEFVVVGARAEMHLKSSPSEVVASGFGMLKSQRGQRAAAADLDPATLTKRWQASTPMSLPEATLRLAQPYVTVEDRDTVTLWHKHCPAATSGSILPTPYTMPVTARAKAWLHLMIANLADV
jgi:hypothetical protein